MTAAAILIAAISPATPLPWSVRADRPWIVVDAKDRICCRVVGMPKEEAVRAAHLVIAAVNTVGGYKAQEDGTWSNE